MSFASVSSAVAALQRIALLRALEAFLAEPRRATSGAPAIWRDAMADMFVPGSVRIRCGGANSRDEARTLLCPGQSSPSGKESISKESKIGFFGQSEAGSGSHRRSNSNRRFLESTL